MPQRRLECTIESWPLTVPFITSEEVIASIDTVLVEIHEGGFVGRGEATGVPFRNETASSMVAQIEAARHAVDAGAAQAELQKLMPAGGARNAVDCALWDLEAKLTGIPAAARIGATPAPFRTVATVSLAEPEAMARQARSLSDFAALKLKLGPRDPVACTAAVRAERPDARLIVDVNMGWSVAQLDEVAPALASLGVEMIEQPVPSRYDEQLRQERYPLPLCADESCHTREDLERLAGSYSMINIKLDKSGGLTEALALAHAAHAAGFAVMVGNMIGTSLAMAPASLLVPHSRFVDLDGALLLRNDRAPRMQLRQDMLDPPHPDLWGA
jgi:L-Ala-D/L-Glu epimerase